MERKPSRPHQPAYKYHIVSQTDDFVVMSPSGGGGPGGGGGGPLGRRKATEESGKVSEDRASVPLPIQSFLWRQTLPFLAQSSGSLEEASCVTLERVVVQNILHGLSPSLSDAVSSIPRWRFLRAAFPHVIHAVAGLLQQRQRLLDAEAGDAAHAKLSSSLLKILYILHWMVLDAAAECQDSEPGRDSDEGLSRFVFPLSCVQIFVRLLGPLFFVLKPSDIQSNIRLRFGKGLWEALWGHSPPPVLCFAAPVKPRRSQITAVPSLKKNLASDAAHGLYVGGADSQHSSAKSRKRTDEDGRRASALPPIRLTGSADPADQTTPTQPTPGQTPSQGPPEALGSLKIRKPEEKRSKHRPQKGRSSRGKGSSAAAKAEAKAEAKKSASVVRSASEYVKGTSQGPALKFMEEGGSSLVEVSDKAPLVELQEICNLSLEEAGGLGAGGCEVVCELCHTVVYREGTILGVCRCKRKRSSLKVLPCQPSQDSQILPDDDTRISMGTVDFAEPPTLPSPSGDETAQWPAAEVEKSFTASIPMMTSSSSSSSIITSSNGSLANDASSPSPPHLHLSPGSSAGAGGAGEGKEAQRQPPPPPTISLLEPGGGAGSLQPSVSVSGSSRGGGGGGFVDPFSFGEGSDEEGDDGLGGEEAEADWGYDLEQASYLDVAVVRCLGSREWAEEGVHWALEYLQRRLFTIHAAAEQRKEVLGAARRRSHSVPAPRFRVSPPPPSASGSKTDLDLSLSRPQPTWAQLTQSSADSPSSPRPRTVHKGSEGSVDSSRDLLGASLSASLAAVSKSHTDSEISYHSDFMPEALGSLPFIRPNGQLSLSTILHALVSVLETCQSLRVCEASLNLLQLLLDMDVMEYGEEEVRKAGETKAEEEKKPEGGAAKTGLGADRVLGLLARGCVAAFLELGCPHGCDDAPRSPQAELLRGQARHCLSRLQQRDAASLSAWLKALVPAQPHRLLRFLHALCGFCMDPAASSAPRGRSVSHVERLRPQDPGAPAPNAPSYRNNFHEARSGLQGILLNIVFKPMVDQLISESASLHAPHNSALYQEVRWLISYAQEAHGNPFRRVLLSPLLDAKQSPQPPSPKPSPNTSSSQAPPSESESWGESGRQGMETGRASDRPSELPLVSDASLPAITLTGPRLSPAPRLAAVSSSEGPLATSTPDTKEKESHKARLARSRGEDSSDSSPGTPRVLGSRPDGDLAIHSSASPLLPPLPNTATTASASAQPPDTTPTPDSLASAPLNGSTPSQPKKQSKLQKALNLFKSKPENQSQEETDASDGSEGGAEEDEENSPQPPPSPSAEKKDRKKISFRNAARSISLLRCGRKRPEKAESGAGEEEAELAEHGLIDQVFIPKRDMVSREGLRAGAARVGFLLQTCRPGSVPDPLLLMGLLDLRAPLLGRAVMLVELAAFVHRCNRGDWPVWVRSEGQTHGPSLGGTAVRQTPAGQRRSNAIMRSAGKLFYRWGVGLGQRLGEILDAEELSPEALVALPAKDKERRQLGVDEDLEDFLDDGAVNVGGERCPPALQLLAAGLLLEITAFVRETLQYLPRTRTPGAPAAGQAKPQGWERLMSHRRWSVLSNTFNASQTSAAGSMHSIVEVGRGEERRISFNPDDELSPHSSHSRVDEEPRGRLTSAPFHQARPTSFKKRASFRLKKPQHHAHDEEGDAQEGWRRGSRRSRKGSEAGSVGTSPSPDHSSVHHEATIPEDAALAPPPQPSTAPDLQAHKEREPPRDLAKEAEAEEAAMLKHLPWLDVLSRMSGAFNFVCQHQGFCHQRCVERVGRQSQRLTVALRKVYGEDFPLEGELDRRKLLLAGLQERQKDRQSQDRRRTSALLSGGGSVGSALSSTGVRRESAMVRQSTAIRGDLQLKLMEKLGETPDIIEAQDSLEKKASSKRSAGGAEEEEAVAVVVRPPLPSSPTLTYLHSQVKGGFHFCLSALLKGAVVLDQKHFQSLIPIAWELLGATSDPHVQGVAAGIFIVSTVKEPTAGVAILRNELKNPDPALRILAMERFYTLWRHRYHCWLGMEEGSQAVFKVPPPGIDFTLPSPPLGQSQVPVADAPWVPHHKTRVQELTLNEEEDTAAQTIMTMTRTRRKQKQELLKRALVAAEERKSEERQSYFLLATPVPQLAAFEPGLFPAPPGAAAKDAGPAKATEELPEEEEEEAAVLEEERRRRQVPVAQPLFPSTLLSLVPVLVELLSDSQVAEDGQAVAQVARKVVWAALVEEPVLFLRHFLEKLTKRERQEELMSLLRKLLLEYRHFPSQTAHTLLNYMVGFVMYQLRTGAEGAGEAVAMALSLMSLVAPSVHGLFFKDLKQTLRKEQCDQAILVTANVPSAKKIIVHGPETDQMGIPAQFLLHEETQFHQLLQDSLEFFNIPDHQLNNYFLVDRKTGTLHPPNAYVRDFYFFRRSYHPQLNLVFFATEEAEEQSHRVALTLKLGDLGKANLVQAILRHSPPALVTQRVYFLHEELVRLPAFPRKALECAWGSYQGPLGAQLARVDALHKASWLQLVASMLKGMENPYVFGDLHLFINVVNGAMLLGCEDPTSLRLCCAAYLNMAVQFQSLFASSGFTLVMPTILRCYSQRETNPVLVSAVEFLCQQLYILHRKPFIVQLFGAAAPLLEGRESLAELDGGRLGSEAFLRLLLALEAVGTRVPDSLEILGLLETELPLRALDLCYRDEPNAFSILQDGLASAVTLVAVAPESRRAYQMLVVIRAVLPHYLAHLDSQMAQPAGGPRSSAEHQALLKHQLHIYSTLVVEMRAVCGACEVLGRPLSGLPRRVDIVNVSNRAQGFPTESPQFLETQEESLVIRQDSGKRTKAEAADWEAQDHSELQRELFRKPRDALLSLAAVFITSTAPRLKELASRLPDPSKVPDVLDHKSHMRLSEVALALLKLAPYDPATMACQGLQLYFTQILPVTDWSVEQNRSALNMILRRLDKTFAKIGKKGGIRRRANWEALSNWLRGLHSTLTLFPYMAHLNSLKTTMQMCVKIVMKEPGAGTGEDASLSSVQGLKPPVTVLSCHSPPPPFHSATLRLLCFMMQALGEQNFSLEHLCQPESLGFNPVDKIESLLCHIIIPLFLRSSVSVGGSEGCVIRGKELSFVLGLMRSAVLGEAGKAGLGASSSLTANVIIRGGNEGMGRQGSVSVGERTQSATISTPRFVRDSVYATVFLALKIIISGFQRELKGEWVRLGRLIKELALKKAGGGALWSLLEFVGTTETPLRVLLGPVLSGAVGEVGRGAGAGELASQRTPTSSTVQDLSSQLKLLRDELMSRPVDQQSRTPTLMETHSESGSINSGGGHRRTSDGRRESRRLSLSVPQKHSRLTPGGPGPSARPPVSPQESLQSPGFVEEATIVEEGEAEDSAGPNDPPQPQPQPSRLARHRSTLRLGKGRRWGRGQKFSARASLDHSDLGDLRAAAEEMELRPFVRRGSSLYRPRPASPDPQPPAQPHQTSTSAAAAPADPSAPGPSGRPRRQGALRNRSQSIDPSLQALPTSLSSALPPKEQPPLPE